MSRHHSNLGGFQVEETFDCYYVGTGDCLRLHVIAPGMQLYGRLTPDAQAQPSICLADAPVDTCEDVNVGISRVFVKPFDSGSWVLIEEYPIPSE